MIQDIAPHTYDLTYRTTAPGETDLALCCRAGQVLLQQEDGLWRLPAFEALPDTLQVNRSRARHLFRIDDGDIYLAEPAPLPPPPADGELEEASLPVGFSWRGGQQLRQMRPMETAFAAVTGLQLARWYKNRRFCGRCGAETEPSAIERALVCPRCGLAEYPRLCPAVIVAVTDGDRLLLTRYQGRSHVKFVLVAGYVEIGETLEDTARREVFEETGLHVKNIRYYKSQPWGFTDTMLSGFYCTLDGSDRITLQESELSEAVWMHRGEIPPWENDVSLTSEMIEHFRLGLI